MEDSKVIGGCPALHDVLIAVILVVSLLCAVAVEVTDSDHGSVVGVYNLRPGKWFCGRLVI